MGPIQMQKQVKCAIRFKCLSLTAGVLLLSVSAAAAAPVVVTNSINLRDGSGTDRCCARRRARGRDRIRLQLMPRRLGRDRRICQPVLFDLGGVVYTTPPPVYVGPPVYEGLEFGFGSGWGWRAVATIGTVSSTIINRGRLRSLRIRA